VIPDHLSQPNPLRVVLSTIHHQRLLIELIHEVLNDLYHIPNWLSLRVELEATFLEKIEKMRSWLVKVKLQTWNHQSCVLSLPAADKTSSRGQPALDLFHLERAGFEWKAFEDREVTDYGCVVVHEPSEMRVCLGEIKKTFDRNVGEDSEKDFRWHVGEIVDLSSSFLFLSGSASHVRRETTLSLPVALLVSHHETLQEMPTC
jgi:hypothetical protein